MHCTSYKLCIGPHIAFAGAIWSGKPNVQVLTTAIPCHYHSSDIKMRDRLLRHLGAFRNASKSLEQYYQELEPSSSSDLSLQCNRHSRIRPLSLPALRCTLSGISQVVLNHCPLEIRPEAHECLGNVEVDLSRIAKGLCKAHPKRSHIGSDIVS